MKKILILITLLMFIACSKDEGTNGDSSNNLPTPDTETTLEKVGLTSIFKNVESTIEKKALVNFEKIERFYYPSGNLKKIKTHLNYDSLATERYRLYEEAFSDKHINNELYGVVNFDLAPSDEDGVVINYTEIFNEVINFKNDFFYDSNGLFIKNIQTDENGIETEFSLLDNYEYDSTGRLSKIKYFLSDSEGDFLCTYEDIFYGVNGRINLINSYKRVSRKEEFKLSTTSFSYHANGFLKERYYKDSFSTKYIYNSWGDLIKETHYAPDGSWLSSYIMEYKNNSMIETTKTSNNNKTITISDFTFKNGILNDINKTVSKYTLKDNQYELMEESTHNFIIIPR